jgi:hypothetical protein|tara:strand:- start:402 stop:578 length:177 start_codon:yes stop_codon:yes gene_type:complete
MELEKKDFETVLSDAEGMLKQALISVLVFKSTIEMAEKKIAMFPEEKKTDSSVSCTKK